MASNYKHTGRHLPIISASANIASGALVYQEGFVGVALTSISSGGSGWIAQGGVWLLDVPSGTVRGDKLYGDLYAGESAALSLTKTATNNTLLGVAITDRASDGTGQVLLRLNPFTEVEGS